VSVEKVSVEKVSVEKVSVEKVHVAKMSRHRSKKHIFMTYSALVIGLNFMLKKGYTAEVI